jgi:hypothetical protein
VIERIRRIGADRRTRSMYGARIAVKSAADTDLNRGCPLRGFVLREQRTVC